MRREPGESVDSYTVRLYREAMTAEEGREPMSDHFFVNTILDASGLEKHEIAMVLSNAAGQLCTESVVPALRRMGPYLRGAPGRPVGRSEHKARRVVPAKLGVMPSVRDDRSSDSRSWRPGGRPHPALTADPEGPPLSWDLVRFSPNMHPCIRGSHLAIRIAFASTVIPAS